MGPSVVKSMTHSAMSDWRAFQLQRAAYDSQRQRGDMPHHRYQETLYEAAACKGCGAWSAGESCVYCGNPKFHATTEQQK